MRRYFGVGVLCVAAVATVTVTAAETRATHLKLNEQAVAFAQQLIRDGRIAADRHGDWKTHRASFAAENDFIAAHGYAEYGKWYLAIDESRGEGSKARYKFPFGDFTNLHRCGVIAARQRARQLGYGEIAEAAAQLQQALDAANRPRPIKKHQ